MVVGLLWVSRCIPGLVYADLVLGVGDCGCTTAGSHQGDVAIVLSLLPGVSLQAIVLGFGETARFFLVFGDG